MWIKELLFNLILIDLNLHGRTWPVAAVSDRTGREGQCILPKSSGLGAGHVGFAAVSLHAVHLVQYLQFRCLCVSKYLSSCCLF